MKKITLAFFAVAALVVIGCQKEEVKEKSPATITLNGIYNESLQTVKSAYDLVGDTYNFKWVSGDKFIAQAYNGVDYNSPTLFTASAGDAAQVPFTGTPASGYELGDYAFYPNLNDGATYPSSNFVYLKTAITPISLEGTTSDIATRVAAASATVQLCGTNIEDKDNPMAHIPMIGVKDANGDYQFTACTGVLKITIKNFPTNATQVRLDRNSGTYPLNGTFVFDTNNEIKSSYVKDSYGLKYLNVTPSTTVEDRSFYFPLPTGTISANSLRVSVFETDHNKAWAQGVVGVAITIQKGVVTELPPITYVSDASVSMIGAANAPKIRMKFAHDQKFHFQITNTEVAPAAYNGVLSSPQTWGIPTSGTLTYFPTVGTSGLKYLYYKITKSDDADDIYMSGHIPFWFLSSTDNDKLPGTYTIAGTINNFGSSYYSDNLQKIAVSNDISKGNLMITYFKGRSCYLDQFLPSLNTTSCIAGEPVYGQFSQSTATATFTTLSIGGTKQFFTDGTGQRYILAADADAGVDIGSGNVEVLATYDTDNIVYTVDTSGDKATLTNTGIVSLKFLKSSNTKWTRFHSVKNSVLTHQ